ncbi:glutamate synthase large subunit [Catelliglobosispora koreensis]|uniref:glutamate synthase large subunit n=1 Tax=Catelliglobosispora koreensis TaxID=129052 RepID=UPI000683E3AC
MIRAFLAHDVSGGRHVTFSAAPYAQGLYDPANEHDACGVAFVVDARGRRSHAIVEAGLTALRNLEHRGAAGCEVNSGDGAGILVQVPHEFLRAVTDFPLPEPTASGEPAYAVGNAFLPADVSQRARAIEVIERIVAEEDVKLLGWRDLPIDAEAADLGATARSVQPHFAQLFIGGESGLALERLAFVVRRRIERETRERGVEVYFPSLSARTVVYKGMLTTDQLPAFFPDLSDARLVSSIALVHSRFSTNTFPSWPLAHPYRYVAHNGEINTVNGNRNWMRAREALLESDLIPGDLRRLFPICTPAASDSASFDEVLELLHLGGRSLPHAVLMMIPEAWENNATMDPARRAFYEFHASVMEPWDGPACIAFTDGTQIGAVLDRNGLRPARWWRTNDDIVVFASEAGVLDFDPATIVAKGRLQPGRMFLVDTAAGRIVDDEEIKSELAAEHPYADWLRAGLMRLSDLPDREHITYGHEAVLRRQLTFGYTEEELRVLVTPAARDGAEPIGSMGTDTPIAVLSERPRLLFDYFSQLFAQVTNPPLDAIREEIVTSVAHTIGSEPNLLAPSAESCRQIVLPFPVLDNDELAKLIHNDLPAFKAVTVSGLYPVRDGDAGLKARLIEICRHISDAIEDGARLIVLSDRDSTADLAPIPSLLLTACVHHHLIREQTRTMVGLVAEAGDAREVHHMALLLGYGASAVNPYLAFESIEDMIATGAITGIEPYKAVRNYVKAMGKGVLKVMSKMGISTMASYIGAQVFEAVGLSQELVKRYFTGTPSKLGGIGLAEIHTEVAARHSRAWRENTRLETGGEYQWRRDGEVHLFNPETVFLLQHSTRTGQFEVFKKYTAAVDAMSRKAATLRGLFELKPGTPIPLDEVESVESIVRRFSTGAMSYGSISAEAHETLAIAMNSIGAKSNTGEGGEDVDRLYDPARRSAVKQVASGRFGVTSEYLVNAADVQIKMAQGAKPGEGGQLPAHKVYPWVARTRHSTPGVGLISPPPHHDIYSIEDLAQLIHDLKNANDQARVHVKLVAEVGVGTIAAGVSKAKADVVLISGHDGGTGASPLTSLKHAGAPWELGLAETQQTLLLNGLRDRIVVQVDGQLKTGRDVVVAALLGAEEFGFATAPLVVSGCIMMRVCHLDTCPVGVATQNPELRKKFNGKPEFVVTFFQYIAEEVRQYLAELGFRSLDEAIGHAEMLDARPAIDHWKASGLDLSPILATVEGTPRNVVTQDHGLDKALDNKLIELAEDALNDRQPVRIELPVRNVNRTVGTMLGSRVTRAFGGKGLPTDTIEVVLTGTAGQSFGAFLPPGVTLRLFGDANDYVGKGLSGGRIIVRPHESATFAAEENIIAGNTILYGATAGELFLRGRVGERFCVRNSGAVAVVEGVGDHGCEYMTGGRVAVLGPTGRNFAAGMSGGVAHVLNLDHSLVNTEMADIEPLSAEDAVELRSMVQRHYAETGSVVAEAILADWPGQVAAFSTIMPRDYKRVLQASRLAELAGRDVDEAIMEAARG